MNEMHRFDGRRTLPILHAANVTTAQLATLESAAQAKTLSALAGDFGLSRPAMSQLVDKLVRAGLLLRTEGEHDRRERHIVVTSKGSALVNRVAAARASRFDAALDRLPKGLVRELSTVLTKVVSALRAEGASTQ